MPLELPLTPKAFGGTSKTFNSHSTPPPSSFQIHWFWSLVQQSPDRVQSLELHRRPYKTGSCRWVPLELPLTPKTFATSKTFNSHSTPPPSSFQIHWLRSLVQQSPDRVQSLDLHRRQYITGSCRWVPLELPLTSQTTPSKNSQPTPYRLPYTSYDSASSS